MLPDAAGAGGEHQCDRPGPCRVAVTGHRSPPSPARLRRSRRPTAAMAGRTSRRSSRIGHRDEDRRPRRLPPACPVRGCGDLRRGVAGDRPRPPHPRRRPRRRPRPARRRWRAASPSSASRPDRRGARRRPAGRPSSSMPTELARPRASSRRSSGSAGESSDGGRGDAPSRPRSRPRRRRGAPRGVQGAGEQREQPVAEQAGREADDRLGERRRSADQEPGDRLRDARPARRRRGSEQQHRRPRWPAPAAAGSRPGRRWHGACGQRRVDGGRQRHRQHRPRQQEDRLRDGERRPAVPVGPRVGQPQDDQDGDLLRADGDRAGQRQLARPRRRVAGGEPQRGPQRAAAAGRSGISRHSDSTTTPSVVPIGEDQLAVGADLRRGRPGRPRRAANSQVRADHGHARQQRGEHRPGEPAVRLQHAGEHDRRCRTAAAAARRSAACSRADVARAPAGRPGEQRRRSARRPAPPAPRAGSAAASVQVSSADAVAATPPPVAGRDRPGQQRHDQAGQRPAGHDLEDDVRDGVGGEVDVAEAVGADRASRSTTVRPNPASRLDDGQHGDERGRPGDPAAPRSARHRSVGGRRPSSSSSRRPRRVLDDLGEADLLAGRGERGEHGEQRRPGRPCRCGRRAPTPSSAPSALAPASPSMISLAEVGGQQRRPRRPSARRRAPPARPAASGAPTSRPALSARPGPQVEQVDQVRGAGDHARAEQPRRPRPRRRRAGACRSTASSAGGGRARPRPTPAILTRPLVTRPSRSAPRCPAKPLRLLLRPAADHVVVEPDRAGSRARRSARPRRPRGSGAPSRGGDGRAGGERRTAGQA